MKLCDRCYKLGEYKPGVREITTSTHESYDLCVTCYESVIEHISSPIQETKELEVKEPVKSIRRKRKPKE